MPLLALILPFPLLAGAAKAPAPRPGAAAPDSMRSHVTRQFELYAPTDDALRLANSEILTAISQFALYLGESPKKMAFVLFRSAAEADRYDYSRLTRRGLRVLPWVVPASPPGMPRPVEEGGDNPDPLPHEAGHSFLNAFVDHSLAAARSSGAGGPATDSVGSGPGPSSASAPNPGTPEPGSVVTGRHPGRPILPDWIEEAVAALCEPPSLQRRRIEFMRAHLDRRIPFAELLTMRQPKAGAPEGPKGGPRNGVRAGGAAAGTPAGAERAAIFTAEALSLARFIAERQDERFVGTIVEGVIRGRTVGDVLNATHSLYSRPEPLEKQWLEWMNPSRAP